MRQVGTGMMTTAGDDVREEDALRVTAQVTALASLCMNLVVPVRTIAT